MERQRTPLPIIIFFIMIFLFAFANAFNLPPLVTLAMLISMIVIILFFSLRPRTQRTRNIPPEFEGIPFRSRIIPRVGRWVIIPIAIGGLIIFILYQNWWLSVKIFEEMYKVKAGIDWWAINFLNNFYFYACISIGLLIALSDPRIIIDKDETGQREIYLHSKLWGAVNAFFTQVFQYSGESPFSTHVRETVWDDKIPLKKGILWKSFEFVIGAIVIGPLVAQDLALKYLLLSNWIESQLISWVDLLQRAFSTLSTIFFTSEYASGTISGVPLGTWLIENSPVLEFLLFARTIIIIFGVIWIIRLIISFIFELRRGNIAGCIRSIALICLLLLTPVLLQVPTQAFDITTPFYVRTLIIGEFILIILAVFFSLKGLYVKSAIGILYARKIILALLIILVVGSLAAGPIIVAVQYGPAMGGHYEEYLWNPKYLPNVEYTRWATGVEQIRESDISSAINTGTNLEILSKIRIFNDAAAKLRLTPSIGVNWMTFPTPVAPATTSVDIVYVNGREYWLAPLTIVMPTGGSSDEQWRSSRLLITHSERILAMDAVTGEIVSIQSVFNLTKPYSIYYGEGGLFESSPQVYIQVSPDIKENSLSDNYVPYNKTVDYTLSGFDKFWFFSGIYGQEQIRLDFARGDFGDVKTLFMRDINQRLSQILLPGMTLDNDPYIVSDGKDIYYLLYVYIDRSMPTQYLDYPANQDNFWRVFATVLVNAYDGSIKGYLLGNSEDNYVLDFYRGMYQQQWNQSVPTWLQSQLRYPEFLFDRQIDSYNTYHVSTPDYWQRGTDFFELTTDSQKKTIEDVRYVSFYLNGTTYWATVRLVEYANAAGKNLAGMYVALNGKDIGNVFLLRTGNTTLTGPQTALDAINNYGLTKTQLTLNNWQSGNILMYVINNNPYYFVPYYGGGTSTTLSPAMIAVVDANSQKVGYYLITNPQNSAEVSSAPQRAYLNLIGSTVVQTAEARKQNVINEFARRGFVVKTPTILNPSVGFSFTQAPISYHNDFDWTATNSTISSFITTFSLTSQTTTIVMWETAPLDPQYLNLGVIINEAGVPTFHYMAFDYS
ncbi:MAG: hypothetical protein QG670_1363 [Thermoproteota archaeon]|nr:hypothetical protein [Thermoproteota archaeon]